MDDEHVDLLLEEEALATIFQGTIKRKISHCGYSARMDNVVATD